MDKTCVSQAKESRYNVQPMYVREYKEWQAAQETQKLAHIVYSNNLPKN